MARTRISINARLGLAGIGTLAILTLAGCAGVSTPSPGPSASASPSAASPTGTGSGACPVVEQTADPATNTLIDLKVDAGSAADRITLVFGTPIAGGPPSSARLRAASPPFSQAGSGRAVNVIGPRYVELHLEGMAIMDDAGNPTYRGPTSLTPGLPALKDIEQTDAFEGVYNFVIGYAGNGCVSLVADGTANTMVVSVGH